MLIGNREFDFQKNAYIMGILNVTPDSFSDGGKWNEVDKALKHVEQMIKDGADIIDIGGESTRPGYIPVDAQDEADRVVPVIEKIKANFDVAISVDTYKAYVAKCAIQAGAHMVNDIWGFKGDCDMSKVVADYNVACCIMHNRDVKLIPYKNYLEDVVSDLKESIELGISAGVSRDNMILDPGIGFGKTLEENLYLMNNLDKICDMGYPVLLGTSRKSMIGLTLDLPVEDRLEGTLATTVMGVMKGCSIVRVHDIKENYRTIKMTKAIMEAQKV